MLYCGEGDACTESEQSRSIVSKKQIPVTLSELSIHAFFSPHSSSTPGKNLANTS